MSQIKIDSLLFQRLLDDHLEVTAEARAFRALRNRSGIGNADALLRFGAAHQEAEKQQRTQIEPIYRFLRDAVAAEDDARIHKLLSGLLPLPPSSAKRSRKP